MTPSTSELLASVTGERRLIAFASAMVAVGLLVATGVASLLVASSWVPSAGGQTAARFVDVAGSIAVVVVLVAVVALVSDRSGRTIVVLAGLGLVVAVVGQVLAPLARWERLGLRSVTSGSDHGGYWAAAFDDGISSVFVDGGDIGQASYRNLALVATAAPWVAAALPALATGTLRSRRTAPRPDALR